MFRLYQDLQVENLPIEKEKIAYMINYCLPDSNAKDKLLKLCDEGFPTKRVSLSSEYGIYFDEMGRDL